MGVLLMMMVLFYYNHKIVSESLNTTDFTDSNIDEAKTGQINRFTDKKWKWVKTIMSNNDVIIPRKSEAFTILFKEDNSFSGTTDCNNFFGKYEKSGNILSFGSIGSTMMSCEDSQELEFIKLLEDVNNFFFNEDGNLVLTSKLDFGSIIFE